MLFGAVRLRAVRTVTFCCSFPLGELEPLHRERWSRSRLYHVRSCSAQSCSDSLILLFVPSEGITVELLHKETVLYFVPYLDIINSSLK